MIPEGLLPLLSDENLPESIQFALAGRGYGRTIYRLQRGLEAMQFIRAWCGCRQYIEWRDDE